MHQKLNDAIEKLGLTDSLPTLLHNAKFTERIVNESRNFLRNKVEPADVPFDVIALGSVGRLEASAESDFDYLILAHELPKLVKQSRDLISAVLELQAKLRLGEPGRTGMFGRVISAPDLTEFIGLEDDTNRSLSHRILILGESVSLYQPERHKTLVQRIIERYLADYPSPKRGVPRFLLNDLLRYWRTLAVDYQAKRWGQLDQDWGLRYLKLLISRKIAFSGSLVPLLLCQEAKVDYFIEQFQMPPLARIAQLLKNEASLQAPLETIILIAEEFAKALSDETFRSEAKTVTAHSDKKTWPMSFRKMRRQADDLQNALEDVFFNSSLLGRRSRRYLSF